MSDNAPFSSHEHNALIRYSAVSYLKQLREEGLSLTEALRCAAARPWPEAATGRRYAVRTLEDWWYDYHNGGFQALARQQRQDAGYRRTLTATQQEWILAQCHQYPRIPIKVAYLRWLKQEEGKDLPSLSTIYRFLKENDFHRGRTPDENPLSGPSKAFEAPYPNDLWMADFSPGPKIITNEGKTLSTQLGALIDDHSRLIPYAAYFTQENTQNFHHILKQAIRRRGLPQKVYVDNGAAFISKHTHIVCANLGIRLLHHKPYRAWSKGKIERVFSTIQLGFESTLVIAQEQARSLQELNAKLSHWLQETYHTRKHEGTGTTPQARFQAGATHLRPIDISHSALEKLFHHRVMRTVRKNGVIRIDNQAYEVDLSLRGRRVEVRYDPFCEGQQHPDIYHQGHSVGKANPVDLHLNSQLYGRRDYQDKRRD